MEFAEFLWFCQFERNAVEAVVFQGSYWFSASGHNGADTLIHKVLWEVFPV